MEKALQSAELLATEVMPHFGVGALLVKRYLST
jgi:hypothetical protein